MTPGEVLVLNWIVGLITLGAVVHLVWALVMDHRVVSSGDRIRRGLQPTARVSQEDLDRARRVVLETLGSRRTVERAEIGRPPRLQGGPLTGIGGTVNLTPLTKDKPTAQAVDNRTVWDRLRDDDS